MKLPQKITKVLKSVLPAALILVAGFFTYQYIGATDAAVEPFFNAEDDGVQFKTGSLNLIGQDKVDCMIGKLATGVAGSTCVAAGVSNDFNVLTTGSQDIAAGLSVLDPYSDWQVADDIDGSELLTTPIQLNVSGVVDVDVIDVDGNSVARESLIVGLDANTSNPFPTIPDIDGDGSITTADIDQDLIAVGTIGAESLVYTTGDAVVPNSANQRRLCANQVGLLYPCNPLAPDVPATYSWQIGAWNSCTSYSCIGSGSQINTNYLKPNGYPSNVPGTIASLGFWNSSVQSGSVTYTNGNVWKMQSGYGGGNLSNVAGGTESQLAGESVTLGGIQTLWRLSSECFPSLTADSCIWEKASVNTGPLGNQSYSQTNYPTQIYNSQLTGQTAAAVTETTSSVSCPAQPNKLSCEGVTGCSWQGSQSRPVQCEDVNGNLAADTSSCTAAAPGSSRVCAVEWYTGTWGACNSGTQTRTVYCRDDLNGGSLPDSACSGAEPASTMACSFADWNGDPIISAPAPHGTNPYLAGTGTLTTASSNLLVGLLSTNFGATSSGAISTLTSSQREYNANYTPATAGKPGEYVYVLSAYCDARPYTANEIATASSLGITLPSKAGYGPNHSQCRWYRKTISTAGGNSIYLSGAIAMAHLF